MNLENCTPKMLKDYKSKLDNGYIQNGEKGFIPDDFYKNDYGEHIWKNMKTRQLNEVREKLKNCEEENPKPQKPKRSNVNSSQFIPIPFQALDNPIFKKKYLKSNKLGTYMWLARNIVRGKMNNDYMNIFENYYQNGKLAVCITTRGFEKQMGTPRSTANDHINELAADGIIRTIKVPKNECYDNQAHVICILGIHKDGKEHWFINDAFEVSGD